MTKPPFIRSPYNYDVKQASDEACVVDSSPSLTVQSMTEDADINTIVRRFGLTGQAPVDARPVFFGDFEEVIDFRSAQDALRRADEAFMQHPADVRARFGNDPQRFLEFCSALNPEGTALANVDEMRRMGLAVPAPSFGGTPVAGPPPIAAPEAS